jgi:acetolactate synthase-1/2/3 large subunit
MRPISPIWVSACLARARDPAATIVNEYTLLPEHCPSTRPGGFFGSSPAAGLGWGAGAALGVKLAEPERQVIAVLGDGSYLFANPVAVHHAASLHRLPVLFVVVNNAMWGAVRRATLGMYPQGEAARSNRPPFIDLDDLPAFEQVCAAAGGYGERVENPAELPAALSRALHAVNVEKRQALLNVICQGGGG